MVVFLTGYGLDFLLSMYLGQGVQAEMVVELSQGSWHLGRVPADVWQLCSQVSIMRTLQLHPRLERRFV